MSQTPGARISQAGSGDLVMSALSHERGASTFCSSAMYMAKPRTMLNIPSVAMKGTIRRRVMMRPLMSPQAPPATMPRRKQKMGFQPASRPSAVATVARAMTDPTLRSIPPEMMMSVMPMAPRATITVWLATVFRL